MSSLLLDTDVLLEILRRSTPALQWLHAQKEFPATSCFSALELLSGSRDKMEYRSVERLLLDFPILYPSLEDLNKAIGLYSPYCLSHGVGRMDVLIASVAVGHNLTLATFNLKHFTPLPHLQVVQPYQR